MRCAPKEICTEIEWSQQLSTNQNFANMRQWKADLERNKSEESTPGDILYSISKIPCYQSQESILETLYIEYREGIQRCSKWTSILAKANERLKHRDEKLIPSTLRCTKLKGLWMTGPVLLQWLWQPNCAPPIFLVISRRIDLIHPTPSSAAPIGRTTQMAGKCRRNVRMKS